MSKVYWNLFCEKYEKMRNAKIALYGTGLIAKEILENCVGYNIVGVYDREKVTGEFCGYEILNIENLAETDVELIVIAAKRENVFTIYRRIYNVVQEADVMLYNVWGDELSAMYGEPIYKFQNENCFQDCRDNLLQLIREHEIISFDIFDTLVMRKVYEPHDVFMAVQKRAEVQGIPVVHYYEKRIEAEQNLIQAIPTLDEIYVEFQQLTGVTDEIRETLKQMEIYMEQEVIIPRREMVEILRYACEQGKQVFLISDMYLPTPVLEDILCQRGIEGYQKLFNSCDYHKPKVNGLFQEYLKEVKGSDYLHIGDNEIADGMFAQNAGMDSYVIEKASTICELSFLGDMKDKVHTWNERILYGLYISRLFNNPFCIDRQSKKLLVERMEDLAYCVVAPTVASFMKLLQKLNDDVRRTVLFSARDGWLLKKIADESNLGLDTIYFYTSRIACLECNGAQEKYNHYKKYMEQQGISSSEEYWFFDLASSGTCMYELVKQFGLKLHGAFVYRYDCQNENKKYLPIMSLFQENAESAFWKHFKFFELILTSPEPSVAGFDYAGMPFFEMEFRSEQELQYTQLLQEQVVGFCRSFLLFMDDSEIVTDLLNGMIEVMDAEKGIVHDARVEQLYIYDSYGIGKIKLFD